MGLARGPGLLGRLRRLVGVLGTALLAALAQSQPALAGGLSVVVAGALFLKRPLHRLVRESLSEQEVQDALRSKTAPEQKANLWQRFKRAGAKVGWIDSHKTPLHLEKALKEMEEKAAAAAAALAAWPARARLWSSPICMSSMAYFFNIAFGSFAVNVYFVPSAFNSITPRSCSA